MTKVWFVIGASTGLGRAFTEYGLQRGYKVSAAVRKPEKIADLVERESGENLLVVKMDVNNREDIKNGIKSTLDKFGRIDVLINNVGYNVIGPIEESTEEIIRAQFETNFFGPVAIIEALLPIMRDQGGGDIVQVSSVRGSVGDAGYGIYSSTKFAIDGFCESLRSEVAVFGIRVMIVKPGAFRTEVLNPKGNLTLTPSSGLYDELPAGRLKKEVLEFHSVQPGDPRRAAVAVDRALADPSPPLHLLLGSDCLKMALEKLEWQAVEYKKWAEVSCSTDFPK